MIIPKINYVLRKKVGQFRNLNFNNQTILKSKYSYSFYNISFKRIHEEQGKGLNVKRYHPIFRALIAELKSRLFFVKQRA